MASVGAKEVVPIHDQHPSSQQRTLDRRAFLGLAARRTAQLGLLGVATPALLAACADDDDPAATPTTSGTATATATGRTQVLVSDVVDHSLDPRGWTGAFGSVTFRMHRGVYNGKDLYYIRTDASDAAYASQEGLVSVPKMSVLASKGPVADAYAIAGGVDGQATVLSTQPGRNDYTPAWRIKRARWTGSPTLLASVADIEAAEAAGDLEVESTSIIVNCPVVKWAGGEMPIDDERTSYLGPGQLLERPDVAVMEVTFKLHECFPGVRYIVTDTALKPMADGMHVVHSPALAGSTRAGATGRTNVFMNGVQGSGPMGFQPSVFDSQAGSPAWSPFWDHMTYGWTDEAAARILRTEAEIHAARDEGALDEFAGTPDTNGETFVVNCPVPILAPNTV